MQSALRLSLALVCAIACTAPTQTEESFRAEVLVPGTALHGIHGLAFDDFGRLYVGSVLGQSIHAIDVETGAIELYVGPPRGTADDLEWGPVGTPAEGMLVWTGVTTGEVYSQRYGGEVTRLALGLPAVNSLAFGPTGRLFVAQVFGPDALWEIDPAGATPPRSIARNLGDLNGFDVGSDGRIYGPLWSKGQVAAVDVESGDLEVIASGFGMPAAANFDSTGNLYVADTARGEIVRVDIRAGERTVVARVRTAIDNIAIARDGGIYVTVMAENAVYRVAPESGEVQTIVSSPLSTAGDIQLVHEDGRDWLYVADTFKLARVDVATGRVEEVARILETPIQFPMHIDVTSEAIALSSTFVNAVQVVERDALESRFTVQRLDGPRGVLLEDDGSVLVLETGRGRLLRLRGPAETDLEVVAVGLAAPCGLIRAGPRAVYASESRAGRITRIDLSTGERTIVAAGLHAPEGLALAPDGTLRVAEVGRQRLVRVDPATGSIEPLARGLPIGYRAAPGPLTTGVAVASDGVVYLSSDLEASIYRLTPP